jgi:hypothetical protein
MIKVDPQWLTAVFTGIVAGAGVWALVYASGQIRQARQEAQIQHLLSLDHEYRSEPMVTYRRVCAQKRLLNMEGPDEEFQLLDFFETVALLANHGYLKDTDVWETFSLDIFSLFADARETIEQDQKDDPAEYSNLSLLVPRLEAIEGSRHGTSAKPSKEDLRKFWEGESRVGVGTPIARRRRVSAKR